jgi:cell division septum initiation protein DivIVA
MTERFAGRLARTFGGFDRTQAELPAWEGDDDEFPPTVASDERWDEVPDRFPVTRHGYDRDAVDQHVDALERELAGLRASGTEPEAVSTEIKRIGEQTAAILQVAHEQADQTRREASTEADRCLQDAAANAVRINDEAQRRLRQLDSDVDRISRERTRLIGDVRAVATALLSIADEAVQRFEPEPTGADLPFPAAPAAHACAEEADFAGLA